MSEAPMTIFAAVAKELFPERNPIHVLSWIRFIRPGGLDRHATGR